MSGCFATSEVYSGKVYYLTEKNGLHFIEITLNGVKTKLLVDTGANKCLLDISQASTYNFNYVLLSEDNYVGLGGLLDIYIVCDYKVEEFFIPFLGADLNQVQTYFIKDGIKIAGVLGSDFLQRNKAVIDFEANKLYLN